MYYAPEDTTQDYGYDLNNDTIAPPVPPGLKIRKGWGEASIALRKTRVRQFVQHMKKDVADEKMAAKCNGNKGTEELLERLIIEAGKNFKVVAENNLDLQNHIRNVNDDLQEFKGKVDKKFKSVCGNADKKFKKVRDEMADLRKEMNKLNLARDEDEDSEDSWDANKM